MSRPLSPERVPTLLPGLCDVELKLALAEDEDRWVESFNFFLFTQGFCTSFSGHPECLLAAYVRVCYWVTCLRVAIGRRVMRTLNAQPTKCFRASAINRALLFYVTFVCLVSVILRVRFSLSFSLHILSFELAHAGGPKCRSNKMLEIRLKWTEKNMTPNRPVKEKHRASRSRRCSMVPADELA